MTPPNVLKPQYLRVSNYEKYQHYKDRRPIWIKLKVDLLSDYDLNKQKPSTRLLAILLILLAATQDNKIPYDLEWMAEELHMSVGSVAAGVESLVTIGFLSVAGRNHSASKLIAKRAASASPEKSREEKKPPSPPSGIQKLKLVACAECHVGGGTHTADCKKGRAA